MVVLFCAHTQTHTPSCTHARTHALMHVHTHTHTIHANTHIHIPCMQTHTHIYTHTMHACMHARTHAHARTHNKFLFLPIVHLCPFALAVVGHHHGRGQFVHLSCLPLLEVNQPLLANIKYRPLCLVQLLGQLSDVLVE